MDDQNRGRLRKTLIGFVYQFHHLLPEFSVVENVMMPLRIKRVSKSKSYSEAVDILERIGLVDRLRNQPATLSGGERQRVAIARALVTKPSLVLADEPTGNLDRENAQKAFNLLIRLVEEFGSSLVIATHDMKLASSCNEIFSLR
jgi:lipoprotein-releasing system ATP-binding protein